MSTTTGASAAHTVSAGEAWLTASAGEMYSITGAGAASFEEAEKMTAGAAYCIGAA